MHVWWAFDAPHISNIPKNFDVHWVVKILQQMYPFKSFRTIIYMQGIAVGHLSGYVRNNIKPIIYENEGMHIHILFV